MSINEADTASDAGVLARLRYETRAEHEAIERSLDLVSDDLALATYRRRIAQFYGFYTPLEDRLQWRAEGWIQPWLDWRQRRKTPLLLQDLEALGFGGTSRLALCEELPRLDTAAECFGCLYVLEGSTLGGQVISRHLRERLALTPETGGRFFHGYGQHTGASWREFRQAIGRFATTTTQHDQAVASARSTFESLRIWCEKGNG